MPTLIVEAAFGIGADTGTMLQLDDSSRGKLNTGTLGTGTANNPVWTDITAYVRAGTITRGSQQIDSPIVTYEAGTCSIVLLNTDSRFDASNLGGPYVDTVTGTTQVTAMRAIRVRAVWGGVYYDLFRGFADTWEVTWVAPNYSECTLNATDAFKVFSGIQRTAGGAVGTGELSSARVNRVLDNIGWPSSDRSISTGNTALQATTLDGTPLDELQLDTNSELGDLYMSGDGKVVFRNRRAVLTDTRSNTSQATFGDGGGAELGYIDLGLTTSDTTFFNEVKVTADGSSNEQIATDTGSQATFYKRTFKPGSNPIVTTDSAANDYAHWLLAVSSDPELRFTTVTIDPPKDATNLYPHALGRQLGDRITIVRRPPGGGTQTRDQFIRAIGHTFDADHWQTVFTLQDAAQYGGFLVLNNSTLGKLDSNRLAF